MSHLHQAARAACAIGPLAAVVLGVALLAQGCSSKEGKDAEANVTVQAATAEKTTIQDEISTDAILYPRDQAGHRAKSERADQKILRGSRQQGARRAIAG